MWESLLYLIGFIYHIIFQGYREKKCVLQSPYPLVLISKYLKAIIEIVAMFLYIPRIREILLIRRTNKQTTDILYNVS